MNPNTKLLLKNFIFTIAFFFVGIGLVYAVGTWTPPTATAPNGNVDAPINVGSLRQFKLGALDVNATSDTAGGPFAIGFTTWGKSIFNGPVEIDSKSTDASVYGLKVNEGWSYFKKPVVFDGQLQIIYGSPGPGKFLTAGTDGWASWATPTGQTGRMASGQFSNWITNGSWDGYRDACIYTNCLSATITPASGSSAILIVATVAVSVNNSGQCALGLFRNGESLVVPFAVANSGGWSLDSQAVTYLDTSHGTNAITYMIKYNGNCNINHSDQTSNGGYSGVSRISVVELMQ